MRKQALYITALCMTACTLLAGVKWQSYEVSVGTNATANVTDSHPIIGAVQEIYVQNASKAGMTNAVSVYVAPSIGTNLTTTVLYTNAAVTASVKARTRILGTDNTGSDLSALAIAEPFICGGDTVTFSLTQSSAVTGVTVKAWIKITD